MADLSRRTAALKAALDALPGAVAEPVRPPRAATPIALMYKVRGKLFAVLSVRGDAFVIVKTDPHLAEVLKSEYEGVGRRSHLDRRFWIAIDLDADVPAKKIKELAVASYERIRESLTRKQQAELAALKR